MSIDEYRLITINRLLVGFLPAFHIATAVVSFFRFESYKIYPKQLYQKRLQHIYQNCVQSSVLEQRIMATTKIADNSQESTSWKQWIRKNLLLLTTLIGVVIGTFFGLFKFLFKIIQVFRRKKTKKKISLNFCSG